MLSSIKRKTGRPTAYYKRRNGERVEGLMRLGDGRWRASGPEKFTFSEPDEDLAILRFRQWQARSQDRKVSVPVDISGLAVEEACQKVSRVGVRAVIERGLPPAYFRTLPEAEFWAAVRQEILTRPQYVAQMTGIEQIGYLADLPKPTPSPSLEEVGNLYLDHAKVSENWQAKCRLFWQEFRDSVEVAKLRDLTQEHLVDYADVVHEAALTPTYARQRFGAVKAIINYPTKRGKWAEDAKRALALCAVLVPPRKSAVAPEPISPAAFHALYAAADDQMKAMLLLALNCCMYGGEVAALDWADLELVKGTLSTERSKTGIVRIAVLWGRTAEALKKQPRPTEAVFITSGTKMRHNHQTLYKTFKAVRKEAGVADVQFAQIRDGAYTAAVESGVELNVCRLLAGHATGISDHYVKRRPQMVAAACAAIEKAYFGSGHA